jgi:hypothetical protein
MLQVVLEGGYLLLLLGNLFDIGCMLLLQFLQPGGVPFGLDLVNCFYFRDDILLFLLGILFGLLWWCEILHLWLEVQVVFGKFHAV